MKLKWIAVVGLALAVPSMTVLTGCSGGSGGLGLGSGGGGGSTNNKFAGVQGSGPLIRNGNGPEQVGLVNFSVNNAGVISGTLNTPVQEVSIRKNAPRAAISASSNVASDGSFSLVFNNVVLGGVSQTITFSSKLTRNGTSASASNTVVTSSVAGAPFSLNLTVSIAAAGGGGTASGTFSISGGNASGGNLTSNAGVATATRANGKVVSLAINFVSASSSLERSVTVFITPTSEVVAGPIDIVGGDASVTYSETLAANPIGGKTFISDTGTVRVDSISATQVKVTLLNVKASAAPIFSGTGIVTISGSGTANIQ